MIVTGLSRRMITCLSGSCRSLRYSLPFLSWLASICSVAIDEIGRIWLAGPSISTELGSDVMCNEDCPDGSLPLNITFTGTLLRIFFSAETRMLVGETDVISMPGGAVKFVWFILRDVVPSVMPDASISAVRSIFEGCGAKLDKALI